MSTVTIRLSDRLKKDLQKISRQQNKSVSDLVRESVRRYVAIEQFRALRKKALPFAEAQGLVTDEDIFKVTTSSPATRACSSEAVPIRPDRQPKGLLHEGSPDIGGRLHPLGLSMGHPD